jgi:two-component system response regulator AlgR
VTAETRLRTLIADDEPLAIERLQLLCADIADVELVGTAADGEAALRLVDALTPDLLLLDIAMPGLDGIGVARAVAQRPSRPGIVFVTAFDAFAVSAFDVAADDYLLKPITRDRLVQAIARVRARRAPAGASASPYLEEIWVPHRAQIIRLDVRDIERIEAERDYMRLHLGLRSFLVHETLAELERKLDPARFIRLHRSAIVRRDRIARLSHDGDGNWEAELACGTRVRVGRSYLAATRAMVGR